jgi:hypothetical protein
MISSAATRPLPRCHPMRCDWSSCRICCGSSHP